MPTLTWLTRSDDIRQMAKVPYRALIGMPEYDYGESEADNLLIQGDNLDGLKALCPYYAGKIKCIFIDPPYNTRKDFEHYQDNLEHAQWLEMMYPRLELLHELLADDGIIYVIIDDDEAHYLKVLMDEIFGRKNFCGMFIWEKKKKPSFLSNMGVITEYVLAYSKNRIQSPPFIGGLTTENKKYPLNNAGNSISILTFPAYTVNFSCENKTFLPQNMSKGNIVTKLLDKLEIVDGKNKNTFKLEGEWRYSQKTLNQIIANGDTLLISRAPFRPNHIKKGGEPKKMKNLLSINHYDMATYEDATNESRLLFGINKAFPYPKPEKLLQALIYAVTTPGDRVLDSFLGSGTTAAVAHKMGRRWLGIEMGEHAKTHCIPRLRAVIDGEQGGISEAEKWHGGGGFHFLRLGDAVFTKDGAVNPKINFSILAAHLWFSETHTPLPPQKRQNLFLGAHHKTGYALLYNGVLSDKRINGGNVLTAITLAHIRKAAKKHDGKIIVFANGCRFGNARLKSENLEFRQIPYDCKKR